jgi:hypothetical protein
MASEGSLIGFCNSRPWCCRQHKRKNGPDGLDVTRCPLWLVPCSSSATCPISGQKLNGLPARRPNVLARLSKKNKTIHRAYGGHLSHAVVKERIIRAFLVEEQKIVKKVLKLQKAKEKAAVKK